MKIKEMNNRQLKKELKQIQEMITVTDCFGVNDLLYESALLKEMDRRGMEG